jgi:hypothetical protein
LRLLRGLISLLMIGGIALVAAPFLLSSLFIDRYGIEIEGRVSAKAERLRTHYSGWSRDSEVTVEYSPPDRAGVANFQTLLSTAEYDALHQGQRVAVHYLQRRDLPKIPLAKVLGQLHLLPVARLAGRRAFTPVQQWLSGPARRVLQWMAAGVLLLIVWRWAQWPGFGWAVAACGLVAFAALMFGDFPRPTPAPTADVRQARGRVTEAGRIDRLLEGERTRGFDAAQPIEVVGIEFVPAGRSEPVLAVDLIDAGSLAQLTPNAEVAIDYEAASPRTAHLRGATRDFAGRNFRGMAIDSAVVVGVIVALLALAKWLDGMWKRLLKR